MWPTAQAGGREAAMVVVVGSLLMRQVPSRARSRIGARVWSVEMSFGGMSLQEADDLLVEEIRVVEVARVLRSLDRENRG